MAKLWQLLQGHPKHAFSEKVKRGEQGKFFKNPPKNSPRLKGPKERWRKCHYPLISMHLNCKDWRRFWRKQRLQKCLNGRDTEIFARFTQNPHFLKKCKGETKGNFSKIAQKVAIVWKAHKPSDENVIIRYLICTKIAKTGEDFGANRGFTSARMAKLWQFS